MRGKLWFTSGLAVGFVLGARAGRETYDELTKTARKVKDHPTVQEAAGTVQEQIKRLVEECREQTAAAVAECRKHCGCRSGAEPAEPDVAEPDVAEPTAPAEPTTPAGPTETGLGDVPREGTI